MNDFHDIESELKKLRPSQTTADFCDRVAQALVREESATPSAGVIAKPKRRFQINWLALGLGVAAATAFLLLARVDFDKTAKSNANVAANTQTAPLNQPQPGLADRFVPSGLTQVVYKTNDEGLVYPSDSPQPMRRLRKHGRETLQFKNPQTGASLKVTYPAEQVELLPISGQ